MGFYAERVLPWMIEAGCGSPPIMRQRARLVPAASGRVLEIGLGSGLNLGFYDPARVERLWGLEPCHGMRQRAEARVRALPFEFHWLDLPGEQIPLADGSVDTVVSTYTLCTIPGWEAALAQVRRVLAPGGRLLFCEHGAAPDAGVLRWQKRLNPVWKCLCGGCHLDRDVPAMLAQAGFRVTRLETAWLPKTPRIAGFNWWGEAVPD